ncbi:MAG: hypothetical protein IT372_17275 [Polyangiaceae bacterium]|nr:hypothetical protein [Polyangiaceae bacterium]
MPIDGGRALTALLAVAIGAGGCAAPALSRDGQLVFAEGGAGRGASMLTANGVELIDRTDVPAPVVRRSANEPWRPATGFLLPQGGVWRETSRAIPVSGHGLAVVLRTSDALVPSWGGEILLRLDALVPTAAFPAAAAREPRVVAVVIDGRNPNTASLVGVALDDLGGRDRAAIIDTSPARAVLPLVPGTHRTLLGAAALRVAPGAPRTSPRARASLPRDLPGALALARGYVATRAVDIRGSGSPPAPYAPSPVDRGAVRQVLVITDGLGVAQAGPRLDREVRALAAQGIRLTAVGAPDRLEPEALAPLGADVHAGGEFAEREDAVAEAVPPPGDVVLDDVELTLSSAPAPLRVLEVSGGTTALSLEVDRILLGDLYAGEARTEVARVAVPPWVPGEPLDIEVTATYRDVTSGERLSARQAIRCRYSNDVERLANLRHGDVIAYASALAMVRRLDRAFIGSQVDHVGGLRPMVAWQARSLARMAKDQHDPALASQAEILSTLLGAIDEE